MNIDKLRVCVIGAGVMANRVHYPCLASFDDVEIAGICGMTPARLSATAERFSIPVERCFPAEHPTGYRRMIEAVAPDAVYAIGEPHVMIDVWMWCLEQGLNLFIEKPMGLTMHQARSLAHVADQGGCITQVSHQRRSCPLLVEMRRKCLDRGPITHAVCEFYKCEPQPFLGARDHMLDDAVHAIDTLRWMCGGEVTRIQAQCRRINTPDINWITATVQFSSGATGILVNSWCSGRRVFRVQMHAPGVYVDAEPENQAILYADGQYDGTVYDTRGVAGSDAFHVFAGFAAKHREFIDAVKSGRNLVSSPFSDVLKTMEVAHAILAQDLLEME